MLYIVNKKVKKKKNNPKFTYMYNLTEKYYAGSDLETLFEKNICVCICYIKFT